MPFVTVIRVDDMATCTARRSIVTRLIIGAHEPGERIVQASFVNIDQRHGDTAAGTRTTIGLSCVGFARLFESLDLSQHIGQAGFRKQVGQISAAVLEHAEHIGRLDAFPGWQWKQAGNDAVLSGHFGVEVGSRYLGGFAVCRIAFTEYVVFERQYAVVVCSAAPEHDAGCHHAANIRIDNFLMACTTGRFSHSVVRRINEANELGTFMIEQRIRAFRVGA